MGTNNTQKKLVAVGVCAVLFTMALAGVFVGLALTSKAANAPTTHDELAVQRFLEQEDENGISNADKLGIDAEDTGTWGNKFLINGGQLQSVGMSGIYHYGHADSLWNKNLYGELDLSGCTSLTEISCDSNQITAINVSGCTALIGITFKYNQVETLNLSGCTQLAEVVAWHNNLAEVDASGCVKLLTLWLGNNNIEEIDLSDSVGGVLKLVDLHGNPLSQSCIDTLSAYVSLFTGVHSDRYQFMYSKSGNFYATVGYQGRCIEMELVFDNDDFIMVDRFDAWEWWIGEGVGFQFLHYGLSAEGFEPLILSKWVQAYHGKLTITSDEFEFVIDDLVIWNDENTFWFDLGGAFTSGIIHIKFDFTGTDSEPPTLDLSASTLDKTDTDLVLAGIDSETVDEWNLTFKWYRKIIDGKGGDFVLVEGTTPKQQVIPFVQDPDYDVTYKCEIYIGGVYETFREKTISPLPQSPPQFPWEFVYIGGGVFLFLLLLLLLLLLLKRRKDEETKKLDI